MLNNRPSPFASAHQRVSDDSNMIPLINIVFLMLIFFMVAGKITAKDAAQFDAPQSLAKTAPATHEQSIILDADGSLWLDNKSFGAINTLSQDDWVEVENQLGAAKNIIFKADANLPASLMDPLLKRLRASDTSNIQLAVQAAP